jgi:hypothetical protein
MIGHTMNIDCVHYRWATEGCKFPLLQQVFKLHNAFPTSSGVLENMFSAASKNLPTDRSSIDPSIFDAQLTCYANRDIACNHNNLAKAPILTIKEVRKKVNSVSFYCDDTCACCVEWLFWPWSIFAHSCHSHMTPVSVSTVLTAWVFACSYHCLVLEQAYTRALMTLQSC